MGWLEAVANPTRLALVRHLAGHGPSSVAELAQATGAHPNTVRPHLESLSEAGVVEPAPVAYTRGRPAYRYRLRDRAVSRRGVRPAATSLARPGEIARVQGGALTIRGRDCDVWLEPCGEQDRAGAWIARLRPCEGGDALRSDVGWPRYYMDRRRAVDEILEWLTRNGQRRNSEWRAA